MARTVAIVDHTSPTIQDVRVRVDESRRASGNVLAPIHFAEPIRTRRKAEQLLVDGDIMQLVLGELKSIRKAIEVLSADRGFDSGDRADEDAPPAEFRQITDDRAVKEITDFIAANEGETVFPDEVAEALDLDLMKVIEICEALVEEGKIARNV